jgi:hypothetical protein
LSENYLITISGGNLITTVDTNYKNKLDSISNDIQFAAVEKDNDEYLIKYKYKNRLNIKNFIFTKNFNLYDILTTIYYLREGYTINEIIGKGIEIKTKYNTWIVQYNEVGQSYCNCPEFSKFQKCRHNTIANVYMQHKQIYTTL